MFLEAGAMSIPVLALLLVIVDGDEGDAGLDETTGEQEILAADLPAVAESAAASFVSPCSWRNSHSVRGCDRFPAIGPGHGESLRIPATDRRDRQNGGAVGWPGGSCTGRGPSLRANGGAAASVLGSIRSGASACQRR